MCIVIRITSKVQYVNGINIFEVILMDKISYANFSNKDVVSGLQRQLGLDKSQFSGLPEGAMQVEDVKLALAQDSKLSFDTLHNVRILARPIDLIKQYEAIKGISDELRNQMISQIGIVTFKVDFHDSKGKVLGDETLARKNYDFLSKNGLLETGKGKILTGINYIVTWDFLTQFGDVLTLKVPDFTDVKVSTK